jgi:carboxymethylenebutenolidase
MSKTIQLTADDGHTFSAYESGTGQNSAAALIILQEIFGVNHHIRSVADTYAAHGFYTLAPALFDRAEPGVELDYSPASSQTARGFLTRIDPSAMLKDIAASIDHARRQVPSGKVGVIGYCMGGSYAWLSATRLHPDAAVGYYGSKVIECIAETPVCPVMLHFGRQDQHIPVSAVEKIQQARPELPVFLYDAGHGFNCNERSSYSQPAASLAFSRSLAFLKETLHA